MGFGFVSQEREQAPRLPPTHPVALDILNEELSSSAATVPTHPSALTQIRKTETSGLSASLHLLRTVHRPRQRGPFYALTDRSIAGNPIVGHVPGRDDAGR